MVFDFIQCSVSVIPTALVAKAKELQVQVLPRKSRTP